MASWPGFVVGIAVIFAYYIVFLLAESLTKGYYANPEAVKNGGRFMAAHLARWMPNITLGLFGLAALIWRARYTEGGLPLRVPDAVRRRFDSWRQSRQTTAPAGDTKRAPRPGNRPVVVIRIPHLRVPVPRLIDRYISRVYLRIVGLSFMALLGLFYISTFIDKSDKIFKGQATTGTVAWLLVFMTPQFVYYVIPIAALLSVLVTFGVLSKSSELTVMKACGVSLYRAAVSVVLLSLVFSGILFGLEQKVLAKANRRADVLDAQIRGRAPRLFDIMNRQWVVGHDGSIYHYSYYNPERDEMTGPRDLPAGPANVDAVERHVRRARRPGSTAGRRPSGWEQDFKSNPPDMDAFHAADARRSGDARLLQDRAAGG